MSATERAFWEAHYDYVELEQLRAIRDAAVALAVKVTEHRRRCYGHICLGAFDDLLAVLGDALPEAGSTAARLDALDVRPVDLPCDTDGAA